jgi:hypothetical protein
MTMLDEAMNCPQCVISVMGEHAGEGVEAIFARKSADVQRTGKTFWLMRSPKARPEQVQGICKTVPAYAIFIEPATQGGARPTTQEVSAKAYSADKVLWHQFPEGLSPVTGKIDANATALVFDMMTTSVGGALDLWGYGNATDNEKPLKFMLGCSTVCAVRKDMSAHPARMKSRYREIVAIARLADPYGVWLR